MPESTLSTNNSLTLPRELSEQLGLKAGDRLAVTVDGEGRIVLTPLRAPETAAQALQQAVCRKNLESPVRFLKGVGPKLAELLAKKGIATVEDALYLLPHRYEDRRAIVPVNRLRPGETQVFSGELLAADTVTSKGGRRFFEAQVRDDSGIVVLKWFNCNPAWMKKTWRPGRRGIFTGQVVQYGFQKEVHHPDAEWLADGETVAMAMARDPVSFGRLVPVYPLTEGLHQKTLRTVMKAVVDSFAPCVESSLPPELVALRGLLPLAEALREVHLPAADADPRSLEEGSDPAHRTLVFDEFFFLELGLALRRRGMTLEPGISFTVNHTYTRPLLKLLPFALTGAQRRVLAEIKEDMMAPHPMHRLVQGDVGSGKTLVALMAALVAVENGCQVAIMAPTELLAEQHYLNIHRWCDELGVRVVLLTASRKGKARLEALAQVARGGAQIVIGTHAVIQEKVEFHRLGLGIVDEQHRFGVLQRGILRRKGENPDILVMTATPIPRTLAMTVFGDLSLSVVDELPPGRSPVETKVFAESRRRQVYAIIREEVAKGRQAYVVYPLVEESEKSELLAATEEHARLQKDIFPDLKLGLLHGRLHPDEKDAVMLAFRDRQYDLLVSTTVVEVGVDVPNATVMVVEAANRFGLAQLHQLRGRVGRSADQSYCLLIPDHEDAAENERLQAMVESNDGFVLAERDLQQRGPGEFLGTRQAGFASSLKMASLSDVQLIELARNQAQALFGRDPDLAEAENQLLGEALERFWGTGKGDVS